MSILMSKDDQCSKVFLVTDRPQVYDTINIKQGVLLLLKLYFLLNLNYQSSTPRSLHFSS